MFSFLFVILGLLLKGFIFLAYLFLFSLFGLPSVSVVIYLVQILLPIIEDSTVTLGVVNCNVRRYYMCCEYLSLWWSCGTYLILLKWSLSIEPICTYVYNGRDFFLCLSLAFVTVGLSPAFPN